MQELTALLGIATALAIGAASPGPSFVMVARAAVSSSRADGIYAALGMGVGGLMFAIASLLGLHGLLLAVPSLYWVLKVAGGFYLAYLGLRIWLSAKKPLISDPIEPNSSHTSATRSFLWVSLLKSVTRRQPSFMQACLQPSFPPQHHWRSNSVLWALSFVSRLVGMQWLRLHFLLTVLAIPICATRLGWIELQEESWLPWG